MPTSRCGNRLSSSALVAGGFCSEPPAPSSARGEPNLHIREMRVRSIRVVTTNALLNMHRIPYCRPLQCDALLRPRRPDVEGLVGDLARAGGNVLHELVWYWDRRHCGPDFQHAG